MDYYLRILEICTVLPMTVSSYRYFHFSKDVSPCYFILLSLISERNHSYYIVKNNAWAPGWLSG